MDIKFMIDTGATDDDILNRIRNEIKEYRDSVSDNRKKAVREAAAVALIEWGKVIADEPMSEEDEKRSFDEMVNTLLRYEKQIQQMKKVGDRIKDFANSLK